MKRKIATKTARREAVIDAPKALGTFTLHPLTFGLVEWLTTTRKNPIVSGGKVELKHAVEICYCFTVPSLDLCRMSKVQIEKSVMEFSHAVDAETFHRIERHVEREFAKYRTTQVIPKSKAVPVPPSRKNRRK